jgi:Domain of unknown function (DUF4167)
MRHNNRRLPNNGGSNSNNNNNRFRRPNNNQGGNQNAQNRTNAIYDRDEMSDIVSPHQRRHASNQQTKFLDLAKNAKQNGDRFEMEYYMQHVEHYTRVLNLAESQDAARHVERSTNNRTNQSVTRTNPADISENNEDNAREIAADGEADEVEVAGETEEERRAKTARNRARRHNRKIRKTSYESNQSEVSEAVTETTRTEPNGLSESSTQPEPSSDNTQNDAAETKQASISKIRRQPRFKINAEADSNNSGEVLRDLLPAPKMDN